MSTLFGDVVKILFYDIHGLLSFGQRLLSVRQRVGLTQAELGKLIGLQPAAISKYEKDLASPNVETLTKLCRALDVSADFLLGLGLPVYDIDVDEKKAHGSKVRVDSRIDDNMTLNELADKIMKLPHDSRNRVMGYIDALSG